jgi:hypothetical protein
MNIRLFFLSRLVGLQFSYHLAVAKLKAKKEDILGNAIAYTMLAFCVLIALVLSAVIYMAYVYPTESDRLMTSIMLVGEAALFVVTLHVWEWNTGKKYIPKCCRPYVAWMAR